MDNSNGFDKKELMEFLRLHFSGADEYFQIQTLSENQLTLTYKTTERSVRPGGTISGPTLMLVADCALYMAILAKQKTAMSAVTTNLSFNFFRKSPGDQNIRAECRLLKVGKTLATGEVFMYAEFGEEPVAHAVGTFAL